MAKAKPEMTRILRIKKENPYVKTITLDMKMKAEPGQFVMIWLPGVDEKPMSIRSSNENLMISVEARGKCSESFTCLKEGDSIGVRGPYGKGFSHVKDCIIVGGGIGMPPLMNLSESMGGNMRMLQGARTKDRLIFTDSHDMMTATDDGSEGHSGFVTELLEKEIIKKKPRIVYTCGPELMMVKVMEICKRHGVGMEASLERYMRCGIGICGSCVCGKSIVCLDGPVFTMEQLEKNPDFGKHALSRSAKKLTLEEYYGGKE